MTAPPDDPPAPPGAAQAHEASLDAFDWLHRPSRRWPRLMHKAVAASRDADACNRLAQQLPAAAQLLLDTLAPQAPGLRWTDAETPEQQVERVLAALFRGCGVPDGAIATTTQQKLPETDEGRILGWRGRAVREAAASLMQNPQLLAVPDEAAARASPLAHVQVLVHDAAAGGLRAELVLQAVDAPGAFLAFVPAPANALTFCARDFCESLAGVTRLLRRQLTRSAAGLHDQALQWNLFTPERPLLSLQGPSAGAAFAVAGLWLLQDHLPPGPLLDALGGLTEGHLRTAGISIAIDEQGELGPVGALGGVRGKAWAYHQTMDRSAPQHLFVHPDNEAEIDKADLPGLQVHPVGNLQGLLQELATTARSHPAFEQALAQMPLHQPEEDDDEQPPPSTEERALRNAVFAKAWMQRAQVRSLRDYCIVRWARWACADGGELHMRFVPLALTPAEGSGGVAPLPSKVERNGLAALLDAVYDDEHHVEVVEALLLRGQAGAGKSTLLQRHEQALAIDYLRRASDTEPDAGRPLQLPLYVPLSGLRADQDPLDWLRRYLQDLYPACDALRNLLRGVALPGSRKVHLRMLLDGLNELATGEGESRVQRATYVVDRLRQALPHSLAPLLSARGQHGFEQLRQVQHGACVQVQPWEPDLVLRYVRRCFSVRGADGQPQLLPEGAALVRELQNPAHRAVADLCRTPFNAAGQVALWSGGHRRLVRHRAELYQRMLHRMLERELAIDPATKQPRNPLFHDDRLLSPADRARLLDAAHWQRDHPTWPRDGALLKGLFRQALAQWQASGLPPNERGTVEVPWDHEADLELGDADPRPRRSVVHWLEPEVRELWRQAVVELGLVADDDQGGTTFRFRHQSWGEYLASVELLQAAPQQQGDEQLEALRARLTRRCFDRPADQELEHQRREADDRWWSRPPGAAWWQRLLVEPIELPLSRLKRDLGRSEAAYAHPRDVPDTAWTDWQWMIHSQALTLDTERDRCTVVLQKWGEVFGCADRFGRADRPFTEQPGCVRAMLLRILWGPIEREVRSRVEQQFGAEVARDLWQARVQLDLAPVGELDEVLGLSLLGQPLPGPWLRWLLRHDLWPALQPSLADLQRRLEGSPQGAWTRPHPALQHLRRVLLLRSLDAGPEARGPVERSGQWALLGSRDAACDPELAEPWRRELQQAYTVQASGQAGRDLRERLQAAQMLGVLGDNLRYERAQAATGPGYRIKPELWTDVGDVHAPQRHRIGSGEEGLPAERPAFITEPLRYFQLARVPVTVMELRAFVEAGGYDPEAAHWRQAGPAAQAWLRQRLGARSSDWRSYRPWMLDQGRWNWALNPVTSITAFEAVAYAIWAEPMLQDPAGAPAPVGLKRWQVRLPSEVQWEAGQRAGPDGLPATALAGRPGHALDFNHAASGWECPSPVGVFSLGYGPAGQADARGNVWEWCSNALPQGPRPYDDARSEAEAHAVWDGADAESPRAVRGGGFYDDVRLCHPARRYHDHPENHNESVGVRLVRVWPPHSEPRTPAAVA